MKPKHVTPKDLRADILDDTRNFLQSLDTSASTEELSLILTRIKDKEALLIKKEGSMMAPDLWKLLHRRLISKINRDLPGK